MPTPRIDHVLHTGLAGCYDTAGTALDCDAPAAAGQDAALQRGTTWPRPRFVEAGEGLVQDLLTGLIWSRDANPAGFPCSWSEAMQAVHDYNRNAWLGRSDWRLPNRRELRSLISHGARRPALPAEHPFRNVFQGWYWSSTSAAKAPAYAWYVHLAGGRMFYGAKSGDCLVWPVCGQSPILPRTGQVRCFDVRGAEIPCDDGYLPPLQDGAVKAGAPWPEPRFKVLPHLDGVPDAVLDRLTNIVWLRETDRDGLMTWREALDAVQELAAATGLPWRLPNINELESLVDASRHTPALPSDHPFGDTRQAYWSSTTSFFETDWTYCLYLDKGAVGVGHKAEREFHVWPALDAADWSGGF